VNAIELYLSSVLLDDPVRFLSRSRHARDRQQPFRLSSDHYAFTYFAALQAGFTPRQAYQIASATYALDFDKNTQPMRINTSLANAFGRHSATASIDKRVLLNFHAFADDKDIELCFLGTAEEAAANPSSYKLAVPAADQYDENGKPTRICTEEQKKIVEQKRQCRKGQLWTMAMNQRNPGPLMHYVQDYHAHYLYNTFIGHGFAGHLPDFLSFNPDGSLAAAHETMQAILAFRDKLGNFVASSSVYPPFPAASMMPGDKLCPTLDPVPPSKKAHVPIAAPGKDDLPQGRPPDPAAIDQMTPG
jgi:hypothetical protein